MDDMDLTIPPRRHEEPVELDVTMPGKRDRKPDGRFDIGDLVMKRYKVLAELGQGGMGVVYKCFDETAGIEVALKALPPELSHNTLEMEDIKDNFQLVHNLHHPNIASSNTLEKDNSNGNYYLIMECCEGEDLRRWLRRKRKEGEITLEDVLPIVKQVADALDYAHKMKIIHRDIKPGNIMINAAGEIKVLDFGLAAQIHTSMTRVSMAYYGTSGTGPYMAPEQWEGRLQDAKADQYALAVMTYEMLAGHPPFESTDAAVLREAVLKSTVPPLANVPKSAEAAILRAMSKTPAERFENCSDFAAALGGKKIKAGKIQKKGGSGKWIAAILFFVMLGGIVFYFSGKEEQKPVVPTVSVVNPPEVAPAVIPQPKPVSTPMPEVVPESQSTDEEREIAKKVQDTYRLQAKVARQKKDIEQENYDRGQTFGRYLDALKDNFEAGKSAMDKNDISVAYASFKEAKKAAEWLIANASLRQEVQALQNQVGNQKSQADRFDAEKLAYLAYNDAIKSVATAVRYYESGDFTAASAAYKSALNGFQRAYDESRKLTVDNILDSARSCKKNQQWQKVFDHAVAALKIDSSNSEAQSLKQEAENNLIPTLEIIAYVNGEQVKATVYSLKTLPDWNTLPWKLKKGKEYEFKVTYKSGENEYIGKVPAFICTANGPHRKEVILEKVVFNGTVTLSNGVKLEMVKIKAGSFTMGSPSGELGRYNDETQHRVTLTRDYWLGKFEVTQAQWKAVMDNNPSYFKSDNRPVEQVSWNDAKEFCNKLNTIYAGKLPDGYKFDLPTEAQWEYACRAGTTTVLNNGKNLTDEKYNCENLAEVAWYDYQNKENQTHPIGQKRPNNWGLYDMHGNVWEWCSDWYGSYNGDAVDPVGPSSGSYRVSRGGSWNIDARYCRSAGRLNYSPDNRGRYLGFRLALVPIQ